METRRQKTAEEHDNYPSYRASVQNAGEQQIWEKQDLKNRAEAQGARTVAVAIELSSSILKSATWSHWPHPNGDWEEIEDYRFQVVTRSR